MKTAVLQRAAKPERTAATEAYIGVFGDRRCTGTDLLRSDVGSGRFGRRFGQDILDEELSNATCLLKMLAQPRRLNPYLLLRKKDSSDIV